MHGKLLSRRALNRATLHRQLLLRRSDRTPVEALEHLVGMQAQTTHTWYVGFWTRLRDCPPEAVAELLTDRRAVRVALMRSTIHLVTAADALALRPVLQPVVERGLTQTYGRRLTGVDRDEVVATARELLDERPLTFGQLGKALARHWPEHDPEALAQAVRALVPLVQVPPRGVWGRSGLAAHQSVEKWLGQLPPPAGSVDDLVLRYLAAFGPATVRDVQVWSGLTRLAEVLERLRPSLVPLRDETGAELFDLPDAVRPDPDVPAAPRFLYDFDNLLLSYADRSRVLTEEFRSRSVTRNGQLPRAVLVDGFTAGTWTTVVERGSALLTVEPFARLSAADAAALEVEGADLLRFLAGDDCSPEVRIVGPR
ncbi:winged helix DNA-binding domain-containing protein [Micromonospora sp. WMMD1102]|uniref:winged helix DNA-binding domain-containing protein n=1 Tax=Micromonospora sp. WMMD1102 TaxID=3016105 RepID=UPI002414E62E|nr:winged helix DNA-binding domain-containing protein [Micromonospora sp. WMMD1102]MDG4790117.1 winged helix DNA-binding domain-containing protein [Micromonospora sp. WMMD1102]